MSPRAKLVAEATRLRKLAARVNVRLRGCPPGILASSHHALTHSDLVVGGLLALPDDWAPEKPVRHSARRGIAPGDWVRFRPASHKSHLPRFDVDKAHRVVAVDPDRTVVILTRAGREFAVSVGCLSKVDGPPVTPEMATALGTVIARTYSVGPMTGETTASAAPAMVDTVNLGGEVQMEITASLPPAPPFLSEEEAGSNGYLPASEDPQ
jgi:hypothetical protein